MVGVFQCLLPTCSHTVVIIFGFNDGDWQAVPLEEQLVSPPFSPPPAVECAFDGYTTNGKGNFFANLRVYVPAGFL